ncbi:MAG: HAD family phosphatase [Dehalococcoidia bacterium]|jgi:HAD superfamily hydrolase (TIGR01509 family)|nr:HAD family phosphatase [Dehalococcoidia bacterium]
MIRAFIFDLDGTLVETELLKAQAYAAVSQDLLDLQGPDERAIDVYRRIVGATDETAARAMVEELGLSDSITGLAHGPEEPWRVLSRLQAERYRSEFATGTRLRSAAYRHSLDLLREQAASGMLVAVATSSMTEQAGRVTEHLGIRRLLDALVGRDQVTNGKPDPEIYLKTAEELRVAPDEVIVVEDSATGLEAAVRAGMRCIAVASAFSADGLKTQTLLDRRWCVYRPEDLADVVQRHLSEAG